MSNNSIWPIDRTLSGAITLDQSGPGSNGNEGLLCIPQSSSITGASSSKCLMSYLRTLIGWGGLTLLHRCSWCILQLQLTGLSVTEYCYWHCIHKVLSVRYTPLCHLMFRMKAKNGMRFENLQKQSFLSSDSEQKGVLLLRCVKKTGFI